MFLKRKLSVKLYTVIIAISAPVIAFWMINRSVIGSGRVCQNGIGVSNDKDDNVNLFNFRNIVVHSSSIRNISNMKTILYWTKSDDEIDFGDEDVFAYCPVWKCVTTKNRSELEIQDFDAILFDAQYINRNDLPQQRSPHQRYIFHNLNTQIYRPAILDDEIYRNFFNWTITYRRDSTVMRPFGVVKIIDTGEYIPPNIPASWKDVSEGIIDDKTRKIVQGKTKLVSWIVSDCVTPSRREIYVKALQQHIPIDIFGPCGLHMCNERNNSCLEKITREYYFYLAVENSLCTDYVTLDVFEFLQHDIVPIVYGAADYPSVLPPGSYIDLRDFTSPKQLADYLWTISQNPKQYLEFFKWKNYFRVETRPEYYTVCDICKKLHRVNRSPNIIDDIYGWWKNAQCLRKPSFKGIQNIGP